MARIKTCVARPWFRFFPNDWANSPAVDAMGAAGEGAYLRLLYRSWPSETCSLPDDDLILAGTSRLGIEAWSGPIGQLVKSQFRSEGGRLYNDKLLEQLEFAMKNSEAGVTGGVAAIGAIVTRCRFALPARRCWCGNR